MWLSSLSQHRKRLAASRPSWCSRWVLYEAALGRDLREVIAGLEHLDDVIDVGQLNFESHDLVAPRFDLPINAGALVHQSADYVSVRHMGTLRTSGDYIYLWLGALAT